MKKTVARLMTLFALSLAVCMALPQGARANPIKHELDLLLKMDALKTSALPRPEIKKLYVQYLNDYYAIPNPGPHKRGDRLLLAIDELYHERLNEILETFTAMIPLVNFENPTPAEIDRIADFHLVVAFDGTNAKAFGIGELLALIDRAKVDSVDALIPLLPEQLRRSFVLSRNSRSLQQSDDENPRAILFGDNARLVLTFNGNPTHKGYNAVEAMQFNARTSEFEFYRLNFPLPRAADGSLVPPAKNPLQCMTCHTTAPKPIWNAYPLWPRFYGERNDLLSAAEKVAYEKYLAQRATHPRYSALIHMDASPLAPFRPDPATKNLQTRPATRFTAMLTRLNSLRLAKKARSAVDYGHHLPLLIYTLNQCEPLSAPVADLGWTQAQADRLGAMILAELIRRNGALAYPAEAALHEKNLIGLFGLAVEDFDLTEAGEKPKGLDYTDGSLPGTVRGILAGAITGDLLAARPALTSAVLSYPSVGYSGNALLVTPFDWAHAQELDAITVPTRFKLSTCGKLLDEVKGSYGF